LPKNVENGLVKEKAGSKPNGVDDLRHLAEVTVCFDSRIFDVSEFQFL
jgi:hypothetical protein